MELTTILITVVVGALIIFAYNQLVYWKRRGIPHIPVIPFLGSRYGKLFFSGDPITKFCDELYANFPNLKYFALTVFNTPTIVLKDPELIREVCVKNFEHAPDHGSFIDERMDPIIGKNVFSLKGDRWKEVRSTLTPSFTAIKMKYLFQLVSEASENFVQYLIDNPKIAELIDTKDAFSRYTNDVIATAAFGISVDSMKEKENEFFLKGKDSVDLSGTVKILKFLAGVTMPRLMRLMGFTYLSKDTNRFFLDLIRNTVNMRDEKKIVRPDMIHLLMQARDSSSVKITIDDITAQAFIFFLAGFDTSSTVMSFLCHHLAYYPDVQEKLREEVDEVLRDGKITYEKLSKFKYMEMVINETLRMYPPVTFIDRVCVKTIKLPSTTPGADDVILEPGTTFWIPSYSLHRDEKYFPSPNEFDPERFNEENKSNVPFIFSPFGIGPRKCIGERFALMEIKLVLARIIQKFLIQPSEKSTKNIEMARKSLNLTPKNGIWLTFKPRV